MSRSALQRRSSFLVVSLFLVTLLGGCIGDSAESPEPTPMPRSSPTSPASRVATAGATPNVAVELGEVVWTRRIDPTTGEPRDVVAEFPTSARTLYAAVPVRNVPPGSVVEATWSINSTPIDRPAQRVRIDEAVPAGWISFYLTWTAEGGWPPGTYSLTLTANGRAAGEAEVTVTRADGARPAG